jgi:hypothetical protein
MWSRAIVAACFHDHILCTAKTLSEVLLDVFYGISEDLESKTLSGQLTAR